MLQLKVNSSSARTLMILSFITTLIFSAENCNDSFPLITFSSTKTLCDCLYFVTVVEILSDICIGGSIIFLTYLLDLWPQLSILSSWSACCLVSIISTSLLQISQWNTFSIHIDYCEYKKK